METHGQKQKFFIYDRKEMGVLLILGVMVAVFAFTLGVHLGKRVGGPVVAHAPGDAEAVPTVPDKIPNRQELNEQSKGAQQAADESLNQALHDEVARTGIKIDTARQVQLPDKPISKEGGATTSNDAHGKEHSAVVAAAPPASASHASASHGTGVPAPSRSATEPSHPASAGGASSDVSDSVALHRSAPAGKFTLQIGSYPALDEARDQADSLEALGLRPYMRQANVKGRDWFRLYVGGYESKEAAEKIGSRYVRQHMIDAYIVAKRVD